LDAKYEKVDVDDVVEQLTHLSQSQRDDLLKVLRKFTKLFDGTLGVYPHRKLHIDIMPGAKPKHVRPYTIARRHSFQTNESDDGIRCTVCLSEPQ
jgi:hypothetical protein